MLQVAVFRDEQERVITGLKKRNWTDEAINETIQKVLSTDETRRSAQTELDNTLAEAKAGGAVTLNYGLFINTIVNFLILAFAIFMMVRWVNKIKGPDEPPPPAMPTKEEILLTEIRDLLKTQKS